MGVSLLSEAATSVSMFNAEPNPALDGCYQSMHILGTITTIENK